MDKHDLNRLDERLLLPVRNLVIQAALAVHRIHLSGSFEVKSKGESGPLTTADLLANTICQAGLSTLYPEAGWLSEETADDLSRLEKNDVWVVDPIDGTREFVKRIPEYSISVGLVSGGRPVLGAIAIPARETIIYGSAASGLRTVSYRTALSEELRRILPDPENCNFTDVDSDALFERVREHFTHAGAADLSSDAIEVHEEPVQFSERKQLLGSKVLVSRSEWKRDKFKPLENDFEFEVGGSIARKLGEVAMGAGDLVVSLYPKNEWDICGGAALIGAQPNGSIVSLSNFQPVSFNARDTLSYGLAAGPKELVDQFVEYFQRNNLGVESSYS